MDSNRDFYINLAATNEVGNHLETSEDLDDGASTKDMEYNQF